MATNINVECPKCGCEFEGDNSQTEHRCLECGMDIEQAAAVPGLTTVIRIRPGMDEAVMALHVEVAKLRQYAETRVIAADSDVKLATDDLSIIVSLKKVIEGKRKEYVGPINDHLKSVNDAFKILTEPLLQADTITRRKVLDYRNEQERIRCEQERINQMRIEAAEAEMKLKGEITEPVDLIETQPPQPERYRAETGTLGKVKTAKYEVVDFSQVPDEYKMLDAAKVGKLVRAGLRSIPGIRIWEEDGLRVTPKNCHAECGEL